MKSLMRFTGLFSAVVLLSSCGSDEGLESEVRLAGVEVLAVEVVGAEAEADAAPVVGTAAQNAGTPPAEFGVAHGIVRLTGNLPAGEARVKITKGAERAGTTARAFPRPAELGSHLLIGRGEIRTGLDDGDVKPRFSEDVGGHAASGTGTNDHRVVFLVVLFYLHVIEIFAG